LRQDFRVRVYSSSCVGRTNRIYLYNILPTTRIDDEETVVIIVEVVKRENTMLDVSTNTKIFAVRKFFNYLQKQALGLAKQSGRTYSATDTSSGSAYLLRQIVTALRLAERRGDQTDFLANVLD
jgi:hypothetical protein